MSLVTLRPLLLGLLVVGLAACGRSSPPESGRPITEGPGDPTAPRSRYAFNNACVVLQPEGSERFVARAGTGYSASADTLATAEAFFMKPSALGSYLLFDRSGSLLTGGTPATATALSAANPNAQLSLRVRGDLTDYPPAPSYDIEPSPERIDAYRGFRDPDIKGTVFTLAAPDGRRLSVTANGALALAAAADEAAQRFTLRVVEGCTTFPEANSNTVGETFKGTTADGRVLGMADVHVHISATTFLGGAQWGQPFHPFGVTHALGDCDAAHGPTGHLDAVGGLFTMDLDGHGTDGWPTFSDWPARDNLTHEAIYWKWLERAWKSGLRVVVNDVVDNETLCELQRNLSGTPLRDCNEMNNAGQQVGSMFAMQDYIDAQYGGPGKGWFRIVYDPAEARRVIADGKLAVVLGIEISNLLNCKLTYNPLRTQEPFEETGSGPLENRYSCAMTETGSDNEILTQLERLHGLGIRQVITIHEFDNAFGGNGIFEGLVLNVGNRENTGGVISEDVNNLIGVLGSPSQTSPLGTLIGGLSSPETPTGEFWTTYDCPTADDPSTGGGFYSGDRAGTVMTSLAPPGCLFLGQGGRPGGTTACYPSTPQCNARWLTPIGLYTYGKLMEFGMVFDVDHLEYEMKTQALELAEAQDPPYPFVSTHGTFGGLSNAQAMRILKNGGFIYPSLNNGPSHLRLMDELLALWEAAGEPFLFGFGFGTDTNGLSAQASPRGTIAAGKEVVYPYTLFTGPGFSALADFAGFDGVVFQQPEERDAQGNGRSWSLDIDGSAHYGMLSGFVEEVRLEGTPEQLAHLFNSAEVYLQMWERTLASSAGIRSRGLQIPDGILRPAPTPDSPIGGF
jgi:hypothetical protein